MDRPGGELADVHRLHYRELVVLARWLVDRPELAEEIVQEAFARTFASWSRVRRLDDPLPYVRRTVVNLANSTLRHRAVVRSLPPATDRVAPSAEHEAVDEELRIEVEAAVRALPRRQRQCVVLRFGFDASVAQIASDLRLSEGTVKKHLHRALAALSETLGEEKSESYQ
jgi:RNA polymerase sigma-70 factor (sigma-E family)